MGVGVFGFGGLRGPSGIVDVLPDDEGFIQSVEAGAAGGGVGHAQGERLLLAMGVRQGEGQGVGDPAFGLERSDDVGDEVQCRGFVTMREDEVHVAGFLFAAAITAYDDAFDARVADALRVRVDEGGDGFDFGAGDLELEVVVVFQADLLDAGEGMPALLDDVVEVAVAVVVVELAGGGCADAPDFVEEAEDAEGGVGFEVGDCLDLAGGMVFVEEGGDLLVAAGEEEDFLGEGEFVGVGCYGCDAGAVGTDADFVCG